MGDFIKCLFQISIDNIHLSTLFQTLSPNIHNMQQLCSSRTALNKSKLFLAKEFIVMKMTHNIITDYRFHYFAYNTHKTDRSVMFWDTTCFELLFSIVAASPAAGARQWWRRRGWGWRRRWSACSWWCPTTAGHHQRGTYASHPWNVSRHSWLCHGGYRHPVRSVDNLLSNYQRRLFRVS